MVAQELLRPRVAPDGATLVDRLDRRGYIHAGRDRVVGENIALGPGRHRLPRIMCAWMNSPGHRENILTRASTSRRRRRARQRVASTDAAPPPPAGPRARRARHVRLPEVTADAKLRRTRHRVSYPGLQWGSFAISWRCRRRSSCSRLRTPRWRRRRRFPPPRRATPSASPTRSRSPAGATSPTCSRCAPGPPTARTAWPSCTSTPRTTSPRSTWCSRAGRPPTGPAGCASACRCAPTAARAGSTSRR